MGDGVRGATDERDHVEGVVPGLLRAPAQADDELAPTGFGFRLRQGFELQAADEIEQRPVLGPDAGELHAPVAEAAQEQRARRIETAEVGEIERALLALFQRLLQRLL